MKQRLTVIMSLAAALAVPAAAAVSAGWLEWRGPAQNGVSSEIRLPDTVSPDKPGEGNANERIKATEAFWAEQVPAGDVRSNPDKYGVGNTKTKKENTNAS